MTVSTTLTDLGELRGAGGRGHGGCSLMHGQRASEAGDAYGTEEKIPIIFTHLNRVEQVIDLHIDEVGYEAQLAARPPLSSARAADAAVFTDETTEANDSTANDMTLLPAVPVVNDAYYFGGAYAFTSLIVDIGTQGVGTWTITWEYYNGSAWTALSGVTDGTTGFTAATGERTVTYTLPTDWATVAVDSVTAYYIRARVSAYTAVTTPPVGTQAWAIGGRPSNEVLVSLQWGVAAGSAFPEVVDTTVIGEVNVHCTVAGK